MSYYSHDVQEGRYPEGLVLIRAYCGRCAQTMLVSWRGSRMQGSFALRIYPKGTWNSERAPTY